MKTASSRQFSDTEIVMDLQSELKELIRDALISAKHAINFVQMSRKIVNDGVKEIENEELRERARISLYRFAEDEMRKAARNFKYSTAFVVLVLSAMNMKSELLQKDMDKHFATLKKDDINKTCRNLATSNARVGGTSLYGNAELTYRFEKQQEMLGELRAKTNLVIASSHADCSLRCSPWQGRVYSLDGTSGTTNDGRKYVPLETATNATFNGRKNGLLGYNCRHTLTAYADGRKEVFVTKAEQNKEREITAIQRAYERQIREAKENALVFRGLDDEKAREYGKKARVITEQYKQFCDKNSRVVYRSRLTI